MKRRLLWLVAVATALTGCKKETPPATAAPAPTPSPPPTAPARADPLLAVPPSDSTLSLLEPQQGRCQWFREDPLTQKRALVASLEGDCKGARLAWSKDSSRVLFWFDPQWLQSAAYSAPTASPAAYPDEKPTPGASSRLYEVGVGSGVVRPLPFPSVEGDLGALLYTQEGITALSLQSLTEEQQAQKSITVDGKVITLDHEGEGIAALAHVYRLGADGQWTRVATQATTTGADLSPGLDALGDLGKGGPTSEDQLTSSVPGHEVEPTAQQRAQLRALLPAPLMKKAQAQEEIDEGDWYHEVTPGGSFYDWVITGELPQTTGHLVLEVNGQPQAVKDVGFTDGELVALRTRGHLLLVSAQSVGTHPRLYDLHTGQRVFTSDTARAVTFWP